MPARRHALAVGAALVFAAVVLAASACGPEDAERTGAGPTVVLGTPNVELLRVAGCAAESAAGEAGYLAHSRASTYAVYCPSVLPVGSHITRALGGRPNTMSTVDFEYGDGWKITIIQGHILIAPRDGEGLPISPAAMDVLIGDVPGGLFIIDGDVPAVLSKGAPGATRYIRGSPGMDPAIIVAVAEGMRRVDPGDA